MWKIKQTKAKAKREAKEAKRYEFDVNQPTPEFVMPKSLDKIKAEFEREPTAYEDRNYVVMRSREDYEEKIIALQDKIGQLLIEKQELNTIIKYLEGRIK